MSSACKALSPFSHPPSQLIPRSLGHFFPTSTLPLSQKSLTDYFSISAGRWAGGAACWTATQAHGFPLPLPGEGALASASIPSHL